MATFRKLPSGKWYAQISTQGVRKNKAFPTKREAQDWARRQEHLIVEGDVEKPSKLTLGDLFERYAREESPKKRGAKWEIIRLGKFQRDRLSDVRLDRLSETDFATWRDRRSKEVAPGSVRREMVLMTCVLSIAQKEWKLIKTNFLTDVKKPKEPPTRNRRVPQTEIDKLVEVAGRDLTTMQARAIHAFRFAIETAMRKSEILGLWNEDVDMGKRIAHLRMTKNGDPRYVPLFPPAIALLEELPKTNGPLFGLTAQTCDVLFRRMRDKAQIEGLTFHDSRHEAITRMAKDKKLEVFELARVVGHKDPRMTLAYYNESAEDIAARYS